MEKNYQIDPKRIYGMSDNQVDPDAPGSIWVPVVSADREECDSPDAKIYVTRYVSSKKNGGQGCSIDRTVGPEPDAGQSAPTGPAGMGRVISADEYRAQIARVKFKQSAGEAQRFVAFHRVRLADFI